MTVEELMKPRYRVLTDWPRSEFEVGEILTMIQTKSHEHLWNGNPAKYITVKECDQYPHLFKKMNWWEEREEKDMPEYVKTNTQVVKVTGWAACYQVVEWETGDVPFEGATRFWIPATKEEYEADQRGEFPINIKNKKQ